MKINENGLRVYGIYATGSIRIEDTTRCIEEVGWNDFIPYQCQRKRGYGKDGLYCKQHAKINERYQ
jgi:hypothetical protein